MCVFSTSPLPSRLSRPSCLSLLSVSSSCPLSPSVSLPLASPHTLTISLPRSLTRPLSISHTLPSPLSSFLLSLPPKMPNVPDFWAFLFQCHLAGLNLAGSSRRGPSKRSDVLQIHRRFHPRWVPTMRKRSHRSEREIRKKCASVQNSRNRDRKHHRLPDPSKKEAQGVREARKKM